MYLYKAYYYGSGDAKFVEDFDNMLNLSYNKDAAFSEKEFAVLPDFARGSSVEDIKYFFKWVKSNGGDFPNLSELMAEIDESMHMANSF